MTKKQRIFYTILFIIIVILIGVFIYILNNDGYKTEDITLEINGSYLLSNGEIKKGYYYESEDWGTISLDSNGKITGLKEGLSLVSLKNSNGKIVKNYVIVIAASKNKEEVAITNVETEEQVTIEQNEVHKIDYKVYPEESKTSVSFNSLNEDIATVDSNGKILGIKAGEAIIEVSANNGEYVREIKVTIEANQAQEKEENTTENRTLKFTSSSVSIDVGDVYEPNYTKTNVDKVLFFTNNNDILTFIDGKITAKKIGTATITITSEDKKINSSMLVSIQNKSEVESIVSSQLQLNLQTGQKYQLKATIMPSTASQSVIWTSSDTSVASVTNGVVEALKEGTSLVTMTSINGKTATCQVSVKKEIVRIESINLNKTDISLNINQVELLSLTVNPSDAISEDINWTSSDASIATANKGKIIALKEGTTVVTARTASGKEAKCTVTVKNIPVDSVTITSEEQELNVGSSVTIKTTILPSDASNKTITWTSSNTSVATINTSGKVTALKEGTVIITATSLNGKKATLNLVIKKVIQVKSITLNKTTATIRVGGVIHLISTILPEDANNKNVTWTSSDASVATVDSNGKITALKKGTTTITATTSNGKIATCIITVIKTYKVHFIRSISSAGNYASDAILIESDGQYGLIDAGHRSNKTAVINYLDSIGVTKLEFFLITHQHLDHYGPYADIMAKYKPTVLYKKRYSENDAEEDNGSWSQERTDGEIALQKQIIAAAANNNVKVVYVDDLNDGTGVYLNDTKITLFNTRNRLTADSAYYRKLTENVNSIVEYIDMNGVKMLLYGDLDQSKWPVYYANKVGKVNLVKIPHHSYNPATNNEISGILSPDYAIVTNSNSVPTGGEISKYTIGNKVYFTGDYVAIIADCSTGVIKLQTK